jgi:phosphatidate cytidylyltransferase
MTEELKKRLMTAAVAVPILLLLIYVGGIPFLLLIITFIIAGIWELNRIMENRGYHPQPEISLLAGAGMALVAYSGNALYLNMYLTLALLAILIFQLGRQDVSLAMNGFSTTIAGVFYIGWLLSHAVLVRNFGLSLRTESVKSAFLLRDSHLGHDVGLFFTIMVLACVFLNDTGAYFAGKNLGKKKLAPTISPNKTWEGFWGGLATAWVTACLVNLVFQSHFSYWHCLAIGTLVAVFGTLGDLLESLIKRDAKIKDSGTFFPGHGGVLDRLDSILFSFPVVYYYLRIIFS